jgi:predicted PurR-regulated permease PerM
MRDSASLLQAPETSQAIGLEPNATSSVAVVARETRGFPADSARPRDEAPAMPQSSGRWAPATKYLVGVGLIALGLVLLYAARSLIPILITGALIAFLITPLMDWLHQRLKLSRGLATGIAYLIAVLSVLSIPLLVVPAVWDGINALRAVEFNALLGQLSSRLTDFIISVQAIPLLGPAIVRIVQPLADLLETLQTGVAPAGVAPVDIFQGLDLSLSAFGEALTGVLGPLVSWLIGAAFTLVVSVYLISGQYSLRRFVVRNTPEAYRPEIATLFDRITRTWQSFFQGQVKLMLLVGLAVMLGNLALGNSYALVLGLISGAFELLPTIGPALALIPGVAFALFFGSSWLPVSNPAFAVIILVFYLLVQVIENQAIVPRVLGKSVELPPLVVLLAALLGGMWGGVIGALIGVPVAATLREVVAYLYGKIVEAPEQQAPPPLEPGMAQGLTYTTRSLLDRVFPRRGRGPTVR